MAVFRYAPDATLPANPHSFMLNLMAYFYSAPMAPFYGSSSHLMKSGQGFGFLVLVRNLGGTHDA